MARLTILTQDEINTLYAIPVLDNEERSFLFALEPDDITYLGTLGNNTANKVNYILQLGYYRAVNYFFQFSFQTVKPDVGFILQNYFPGEPFPKKQVLRKYHYRNRSEVMAKFQLQEASAAFQDQLINEAKALAKRHSLSRFVLEGLLSYCLQHNVVRPAYSSLQDMVSSALMAERNRLATTFCMATDKDLHAQLDKLLEDDNVHRILHGLG